MYTDESITVGTRDDVKQNGQINLPPGSCREIFVAITNFYEYDATKCHLDLSSVFVPRGPLYRRDKIDTTSALAQLKGTQKYRFFDIKINIDNNLNDLFLRNDVMISVQAYYLMKSPKL